MCGLAIGVPREMPDIKPKQPASLLIHHDTYRTDSLIPELLKYDTDVTQYNATRSGTKSDNDWIDHIISYYREAMNYRMLHEFAQRGFRPDR